MSGVHIHLSLDAFFDHCEGIGDNVLAWVVETPGAAYPSVVNDPNSRGVVFVFPDELSATLFKLRWM